MTSYRQCNQEDRNMLSALRRRGLTQEEMARELGKDQSTISRELMRNGNEDGTYHAGEARKKKEERKQRASERQERIKNDSWLESYIQRKLRRYWSPEQIAGRVRKSHNVVVCHETIYKYIYDVRPELKEYLLTLNN